MNETHEQGVGEQNAQVLGHSHGQKYRGGEVVSEGNIPNLRPLVQLLVVEKFVWWWVGVKDRFSVQL